MIQLGRKLERRVRNALSSCILSLACGCASAPGFLVELDGKPTLQRAPADSSGGLSVVLGPELTAQLSFLYRYIQEVEFAVCLEGRISGDKIEVDRFRMANMSVTAANRVRYQHCDVPGYVGMAHNHPPSPGRPGTSCYFSEMDKKTFVSDTKAVIDVVICGDRQFAYQSKPARSSSRAARD